MHHKPRNWTEEMVKSELSKFYSEISEIPTNSLLREFGRNDLAVQISKRGGFLKFRKELNIPEPKSNSHTGWSGEIAAMDMLEKRGYVCSRKPGVKNPYDLLVGGVVRIDVKATKFAQCGNSAGWFFRMGKEITADIVLCFFLDSKDVYIFPWFRVPPTNLTITKAGSAHAFYKNNFSIIDEMLKPREAEMSRFPECSRFKDRPSYPSIVTPCSPPAKP